MIRDEPYRRNQYVPHATRGEIPQMIQNVRLQPGLVGRAAAALVHKVPSLEPHRFRDQTGSFAKLLFIPAGSSEGARDAVRRCDQARVLAVEL
jgi:hypothetical protein